MIVAGLAGMLIVAGTGQQASGAAAPAPVAVQPIRLIATQEGDRIRIEVIGQSPTAVAARFSLDARSGSNRTMQKGTAQLVPNRAATLVTVALNGKGSGWSAVLHVDVTGGTSYEIRLPAA